MAVTLIDVFDAQAYAGRNGIQFEENEFYICLLFKDSQHMGADDISWNLQLGMYFKEPLRKDADPNDLEWDGSHAFEHEFDLRLQKPPFRSLPSVVRSAIKPEDYEKNHLCLFLNFFVPKRDTRTHITLNSKTFGLDMGRYQKGELKIEVFCSSAGEKSMKIVEYKESSGWVGPNSEELKAVISAAESVKAPPKKAIKALEAKIFKKGKKKAAQKKKAAKPKKRGK